MPAWHLISASPAALQLKTEPQKGSLHGVSPEALPDSWALAHRSPSPAPQETPPGFWGMAQACPWPLGRRWESWLLHAWGLLAQYCPEQQHT